MGFQEGHIFKRGKRGCEYHTLSHPNLVPNLRLVAAILREKQAASSLHFAAKTGLQ